MRCPYCSTNDTQVKDSRPTDEGTAIRRRRVCPNCSGRFTTFERIYAREIAVVKRSGAHVPFDRSKLERSVQIALRKRPVDPERIDAFVNNLVREIEGAGQSEVSSVRIGKLVLEGLKKLDDVAYARFASVYRDFKGAEDFKNVLDELEAGEATPRPRL
ncbi:MAG: transcriptional regulator NrdR [Pseudomonadota bacterium]